MVAEALSCGIPVLSTDVGDTGMLVRDGLDGYVVGVDDADSFCRKLVQLIASSELRQRIGKSGRDWMLRTRSPERLLEKTLGVYREAGWMIP